MRSKIPRDILIRLRDKTDPRYGCVPEKRPIEEYIRKGIVNIDKPPGPTSHQVVSWVKDILRLNKAGHSGTLDPRVTGVLPTALEDSTKILQTLLSAEKEYITVMSLHGDVSMHEIKGIFNYFQGDIYQRPPLKSSVKRNLRVKRILKLCPRD